MGPQILASVMALAIFALHATPGSPGEENERVEKYRGLIRRAVSQLASEEAETRRMGLLILIDELGRKGAQQYLLLSPEEEKVMASRAVEGAISSLATRGDDATRSRVSNAWIGQRTLETLALHSDVTRQAYAERLAEVLAHLEQLDLDSRKSIIGQLGALGRLAEPAVPMLGAKLVEPEEGLVAACALGHVGGESAKDHLRAAIQHESELIREFGFKGWQHFATELSFADLRDVAAGLHDERPRIRDAAARAFLHQRWRVQKSGLDARALAGLAATAPLEAPGEFGRVRRAACLLLGMLGEHGRSRADELVKLLISDASGYVRREAADALARVAPTEATAERLVDALEQEADESVRLALSKSIRHLASHGGTVRERLAASVRREEARGAHDLARSLQHTIELIDRETAR